MKFDTLSKAPESKPEIRVYQISSDQIGFLTSLVEAYDGIGHVRTLDQRRGIIECWIMPHATALFDDLLERIGREYALQRLNMDFD